MRLRVALRSTGLWALALTALTLLPLSINAEVRLPRVFSSHMVVQQQKPLPVWGWAEPGETVTVEFGPDKRQTRANARGEWKLELPARPAGGPFTLIVTGSNTVRFDDVMVGEVWLCSGQSNMEMGIGLAQNSKAEIAQASYPGIRLLKVTRRWTPLPQSDIDDTWKVCSPETVAQGGWSGFSAAAYFFGRELHKQLGVAVGLIDATWGGTRIESWTPPEGFAAVPALARDFQLVQLGDPRSALHRRHLAQALEATQEWLGAARQALTNQTLVPPMPAYPAELQPPHDVQNPTALYNGMIHPLCPYAIRGVIWYQGESNREEGRFYTERMKGLIEGWRKLWGEGRFPFYYVQIAPFDYHENPEIEARFWEAQDAAQAIPNTGMAVVNDIGNLKDIHPTNKQEVGHRLALWALAKTYGLKDLLCSGPSFKSMSVAGNTLRVRFDQVGAGLASRDGKPLNWFELVDAEQVKFVKAEARIDGDTIVLSAPGVEHPVAMRFAWSMLAEPNLMNSAGLPASAFRAGTVPDLLSLKVPEAKDYQVLYDLDLSKLGPAIHYDIDNRTRLEHRGLERVAYFLELQRAGGGTDYLYVSMDAFDSDQDKLGIPTLQCGARFQQNVANLDVYSNVKGIVTGQGLSGGNIEFWPNNYGPANGANVPNASDTAWDFGDQPMDPADGYGSMQVHNHEARQTLFAINHWREGNHADLGIGNQPTGNPDWTFAGNAGSYAAKRLRVLVKLK